MKVGVTGASGFIGGHVVRTLRARGDEVCGLLRDPSALPGYEGRLVDFAKLDRLAETLSGLECVVHAAAHVPKTYTDPAEARMCLEVNALGTLALLQACVESGVRRVVVYSGNVYRLGSVPVDEDGAIYPSARAPYYLISKACADFYADAVSREGKLSVVILRPSAVYGPGLLRGMIPSFAAKLHAGEPVVIQDGGRYRADLVYVEDVAHATVTALHSEACGAFNLGSGATLSSWEVAEELARLLGASRDLIKVQPPTTDEATGFSPLDIGRARQAFGYAPRSPSQGLADYVTWWRGRT